MTTEAQRPKARRWEVIKLIFGWRPIHTDGATVYDFW